MSQPIGRGAIPRLIEIDELKFEEMCRTLLDAQPDILGCDRFGVRGQAQSGVDLIGRLKAGGLVVAQCKRYARVTAALVEVASDDFFDEWEYWCQQDVRRFILLLASSASQRKVGEAILKQQARFREQGVEYDVWDDGRIAQRLAPHRAIVARFMSPAWADELCGGPLPAGMQGGGPLIDGVAPGIAIAAVDGQPSADLDGIQERANEGFREAALGELRSLRSDARRWAALQPQQQSRTLRLEAAILHARGAPAGQISGLLDQADALFPPKSRALRARVVETAEGPEAALQYLSSPQEPDEVEAVARLHILLNQPRAALEVLAAPRQHADAEIHRWTALAHAVLGEIPQARLAIGKALALKPRHTQVRIAAGMIDYLASLALAARPMRLMVWPAPVPWELVQRDNDGLAHLAAAEERFSALLQDAEAEADLMPIQAWRLACLANQPHKTQEAESYGRELLAANPRHHMALAWAMARNWDVPYGASAKALSRALAEQQADGDALLALVGLRLRAKKYNDALELLDRHRGLLSGPRADGLWALWRVQVLTQAGRLDEARAVAGTVEAGQASLWAVRWAEAEDRHEFDGYLRDASAWWRERGDADPLLRGCFLLGAQERVKREHWALLAAQREFLARDVGTAAAVALAARTSWELKEYSACLRTLDECRGAFSDGRLPMDLRQMRLACCKLLGFVGEALAEAEALAREEPTPENLLNLVEVHRSIGDMRAAALAARGLQKSPVLPPPTTLYLAQALAGEDPVLARGFWRQGRDVGFADEQVPAAVFIGHRLRIDEREMQPLMTRMTELAASGTSPAVRALSLDEAKAYVEQALERGEELDRKYKQAAVPMHSLAEAQGVSLAWPYHACLSGRERSREPQGALLARWGGHLALESFPAHPEDVSLVVDISALLLGEHLEILTAVEGAFAPIRVPHSLAHALDLMESEIRPAQPGRIAAIERIEALITSGALRVGAAAARERWGAISDALAEDMGPRWVDTVSAAHARGGVVVDFMPIRRADHEAAPRGLSAEVEAHLVSGGDIARALRELGVLSENRHANALRYVDPPVRAALTLPKGTNVFLDAGLASVLAMAGILEDTCAAFVVALPEEDRRHVADEITAARGRNELAEWVGGLRRRISDGLQAGRYVQQAAVSGAQLPPLEKMGPSTRVLLEALVPLHGKAGALWIEDRCIATQAPRLGRNVLGAYEILRLLRHYKAIEDETYFDRLLQLRRARVYFIPAEADELLHWLTRTGATVAFAETEELATLRRYFAAAIEAEVFTLPAGDRPDVAEAPFVTSLLHAVRGALRGVWNSSAPSQAKRSISEWLWESLSIHEVQRLPLGAREPRPEQLAVSLASLSLLDPPDGATLLTERDDESEFGEWIERRVLADRFDVDPGLRSVVAGHLRSYLLMPPPREPPDEDHEEAWRRIMGRWADRLPRSLREEIQEDAELLQRLGRRLRVSVSIGPLSFPQETVWTDLARAVDQGRAETTTTKGDVITVEATRKDAGVWLLAFKGGGREPLPWPHPLHGLLSSNLQEREATLRHHRVLFDCSNARFEAVLAEIATLPAPGDRIDAAWKWLASSVVARYDTLRAKLQPGASLQREDLEPPPLERLLGRWRLPAPGSDALSAEQLAEATSTLIADLGLRRALTHLCALPTPLPISLVQAVEALAADERRALLLEHDARSASVVARFHSLWLLLRFAESEGLWAAARAQLGWLAHEGLGACRTLLALAQLATDQIQRQRGAAGFGVASRVAAAWIHAHELDTLFQDAQPPEDWVRGLVQWGVRGAPAEWLDPTPALMCDAAWPDYVPPEVLLVFGLSYAASAHAARAAALFEEHRSLLFEQLTWVADGVTRLPVPALHRLGRVQPNALDSFLCWREEVASVLGSEVASVLTPESLDYALGWSVRQLEERPNDLQAWVQFVARQSWHPPPEALVPRLEALLPRVEMRLLMARGEDIAGAYNVLLFACVQRGLGQLHIQDGLIRALVVDYARCLNTVDATALATSHSEGNLWEACRRGSITRGDPEASARRLAELLRAAVDAWPPGGAGCRAYVQLLCDRLPVAQARWLWSLLIHLRARP